MTIDELLISYAVRVNRGSGVLIGALSSDFTYILTAKHVIADQPIVVYRGARQLSIIGDPYHHPEYDCSIIKVEFQSDILQYIFRGEIGSESTISFVGFPVSNIESDSLHKIYVGKPNNQANQTIVCNLDGGPSQNSIEGMSGGGVYYIFEGKPYLWGIEFRMDDEEADARYGRIRCYSISCFDEIIIANQLLMMAPFYMRCFSNFQGKVFQFNAANPQNVQKLREILSEQAQYLIENNMPAPHDLMIRYKRELLLGEIEPDSSMLDMGLWLAYLEFAVICSILDDHFIIDETYLKDLDRRRRFMYTCSSENWLRRLSDIVKSAKSMLDADGTIFVNSPDEGATTLADPIDIEEILEDIALSPKYREAMRIDNANGDIVNTYSFVHMKGLCGDYVLRKHREYGNSRPNQLLKIFKDYYGRAIKEKS